MSIEPKYTLKVNIRAQEEREKREKERQLSEALSSWPPTKARKRRGLNFHQPGTFVAQAEQLRKKARLEELRRKIAAKADKTGIAEAAKLATLTTNPVKATSSDLTSSDTTVHVEIDEEIPDIEWWDRPILGRHNLGDVIPKLMEGSIKPEKIFQGITNLVEHPPAKKPPGPDISERNIEMPIYMTDKDREKLRRQNRRNQELEKQEKIKLGLLPKPEPKLKRSNIMYALGDEALTNPSLAEKMVRDQEEKRLQAHLEHNESKKLTLEEKRAKKLRKIQEDLSVTGVWVSVFRVWNLQKQSYHLKRVSQNVKQLTMTGVTALFKDINLIIAEGGPKQQRKFKHLMLDRIKWNDVQSDSQNTQTDSEIKMDVASVENRCALVWQGEVTTQIFRNFRVKQFDNETSSRKFFRELAIEHYWDLAHKMSILESLDRVQ